MTNLSRTGPVLYGVFGSGGCGRGVLPVAASMLSAAGASDSHELVFVDDAPSAARLNGRRVMTLEEFVAEPAESRKISLAVADAGVREQLDARCREFDVEFFCISAPNVVTMDAVEVGEGAILSPFVTLTSNIRIGRHFHGNLYSYVEHDCQIGDYVTFAPSVRCNGNVIIEDHAYLGAGCVLKQGVPGNPLVIGRGAVVGMGAVVTRNVPAGATVVGNPARPMERA